MTVAAGPADRAAQDEGPEVGRVDRQEEAREGKEGRRGEVDQVGLCLGRTNIISRFWGSRQRRSRG